MHLKDIYVENFKSFGRKIHIPFLPGYTTITGPNGSGKSNIADAILFVLGPKSSKAIRAGKLTDLIFDGGKEKKPAGYCRVVLSFDNTDRIIPVDEDEVRISRVIRLHTGPVRPRKTAAAAQAAGAAPETKPEGDQAAAPPEPEPPVELGVPVTEETVAEPGVPKKPRDPYYSYFYVNERPSSMSEFDNLLAHARISAEGYNLVQQGDINRIVLMTNLDRRRLLDQIAGITQYDEDIDRADDKRHATEENLGTIGTLLDEVKRQVGQLQRERDSAMKYKGLKDKRDDAKVQMSFRKKQDVEDEIALIGKQLGELQKDVEKRGQETEELQKKLARSKTDVESYENKIADAGGEDAKELREKIEQLRLEMMRAQDGVDTAREKIKTFKEAGSRMLSELKALEKDMSALQQEQDTLSEEMANLRDLEQDTGGELKALNEGVAKTDSKAFKLQRDIAVGKKEIETKDDDQHKLLLEKERLEDKLLRLNQDVAQVEEKIKQYEFQVKDIDFDLRNLKSEAKSSTTSRKDIQGDYQSKKKEEEKLVKASLELEDRARELRRRWEQLRAEATAVANVQKGYTAAVEAVLDARDKGELKGVHGTIAELATVKQEYEAALGVAAGGRMQSIVVDNDESAAACINYLKQKKIGRAIFLPLNKMLQGRPSGKALMSVKDPASLGYAMELVKFKEEYKAAFWFVFGDTIVVKHLDTLRKLMGGVRLVTLDGDLAEPSGAMIGGTPEQSMLKFGAPSPTEQKKVGVLLKEAVEAADKVTKRLAELRTELTQMEREVTETRSAVSEVEVKSAAMEFKRKEFAETRDTMRKDREARLKERDEVNVAIERTKQKLSEMDGVLGALKKQRDDLAKSLVQATPLQFQAKGKKLQEALIKVQNDLRDRGSALATSAAKLKLLEEKRDGLKRAVAATLKEQKETEASILKFKDVAQKSSDSLNVLMEAEEKSSKEVKGLQAKRDDAFKFKTDLESSVEKMNGKLQTLGDMGISLRSKQRLLEDKLSEVMAEIGSMELKGKAKLPPLLDIETTVKELDLQMQALEPVNMLAIDEYDKQATRSDELGKELEQLNTQRENLMKLVEELNGKKKFGLLKVFDAISKNFKEIYKDLSGGGSAELLLENPESPFEGGLLIKAQPPDKGPKRLESLSGGEKSLTALSLIFSIQRYQPSPFYLLDEVDMFLDAINAEHVAAMIKKNSQLAQFVQITLRKVTLAKADHRYGVTMQGNGVSDIIGNVRLSDVKDDGSIHNDGHGKGPEK